ncbi:MAG: type II secretion system minor pseudopilin GspI [Pseudomonadota bacterium]
MASDQVILTSCQRMAYGRAFTLIEVLIALAVVALALLALSQTGGRAIDTQYQLEQRSIALWVASNQLAQAELNRPIEAGTRSGLVQMANQSWQWQATTELAPGGQLWRVDLLVYDQNDQLVLTHSGFLGR